MTGAAQQTNSDADLAQRAQRGDRQAYAELVVASRAAVVGVVYRMCADPGLAEEAAQEAFLRAWNHLAEYQSKYSFRSWVCRIAINAALDVLRRERQSLDITEIDLASPEPGPERLVEQHELLLRVRQAVMDLPATTRSVLILREWGGLAYSEIAATLNIPMGTVMSRLNTARSGLRQQLAAWMEVV